MSVLTVKALVASSRRRQRRGPLLRLAHASRGTTAWRWCRASPWVHP